MKNINNCAQMRSRQAKARKSIEDEGHDVHDGDDADDDDDADGDVVHLI